MVQSLFGSLSLWRCLKPINLANRTIFSATVAAKTKLTTATFDQPSRSVKYNDVKHYYSENGEFDPPLQDVIDRFYRLRWGAFIHPRAGRHRHLYRRSEAERERRKDHILTNRATSFLLNNLLNAHWRKPKYYPEDIYEPYHQRTGVPWDYELKKPKFFP